VHVQSNQVALAVLCSCGQIKLFLSFTSWLVVGNHCQLPRLSTFDPLHVTPRSHVGSFLCAVKGHLLVP
jgi:hypothetical protein